MPRPIRLALFSSLLLTGWIATPSVATACGGFVFQETAGSMEGQQIFVGFGEDETLMVLSATYADASGEMAFVLPLASPPVSVADGDAALFRALSAGTAPRFDIDNEDPCAEATAASAGSFGGNEDGVDVYDMGSTATYDYVVLGGDTGQSITLWLEQEGFAIPPELQTSLDPYVAQNWVFLAARLRADQARGTLAPLALSLPTMPPATFRIPFAFGAPSVPEGEAVDLTLYFVAPETVIPANYALETISLDDVELDAASDYYQTNYAELFDAATASDPEGAWVIEFAQGDWTTAQLDLGLASACAHGGYGTGGPTDLCSEPAPDPWLGGASVSGRITRLRTRLSAAQLRDMTFQTAPAEDVRLQGTVSREADCGGEGCGCSSRPTSLFPWVAGVFLFVPLLARRRRDCSA